MTANDSPSVFVRLLHVIDVLSRVVLTVFAFVFLAFAGFFFLMVAAGMAAGGEEQVEIADETALVLAPRGSIVEQLSGDAMERAIQQITDSEVPEALLKDLVDAVNEAKDDERVKVLYVNLNQMQGAGLSKLQDLRQAIYDFKESGKPVLAAADAYDTSRYHLATSADEIYLHELGGVFLDGYGVYPTYFKHAIDRLGVDMNIFHVGKYKSAIEPFVRDDMSEAAREARSVWLSDLWNAYLEDVATARNMTPEDVAASVTDLNAHLLEAEGDMAQMALRLGLVDHVGQRDAIRQRLIELAGENEKNHSFNAVGYLNYLKAVKHRNPKSDNGTVAVVVAKGTILNGEQSPGTIGGDSTAALIRKARHDEDTKAVVLRVDSGGGSAFASEVIRRELELAREDGKPVVVSMGSVAASGGYWISTSSDEIWASPNTITGSIGIFGFFPTLQKPLDDYLGMTVDGIGTTWLKELRPDREMPEEAKVLMQRLIERGYQEFLERVGKARDMAPEDVDPIAQGRVWSGARAHELGLVDQLGGLSEAIASAAAHAGLGDDYGVRYVEKELDFADQLLLEILQDVSAFYRPPARGVGSLSITAKLQRTVREQVELFNSFDDPMGIYAHCLCEVD